MKIEDFKLPLNGGNPTTGEKHLEKVLQVVGQKLNFYFNRETRIGKFKNKSRRVDFCFNYDNRAYIIEFDGIQHSRPIQKFGGLETYKEIKARDRWENRMCAKNKVCLIRYKVFSKTGTANDCIHAQKELIKFITPKRVEEDILKAQHCKYVQNGVSYGRNKVRIALDLDDCCFDFIGEFNKKFNCRLDQLPQDEISEKVLELKKDKTFWSNLPVVEKPNFIPELYCTKRINSKAYTIKCLQKHDFPVKHICQLSKQTSNKARYIKNKCDILIDDSWYNVEQCLKSGFPALLVTRPHNEHIKTQYRVHHLNYSEIADKYYQLQRKGKWA